MILAAGRGKRLRPLTLKRSKAMLPILGKPMVVRVMKNIQEAGIRDFILVVSSEDAEIITYFAEHLPEYKFAFQKEPLGMAHALNCAAPFIRGDFLLSACDSLLPPDHMAELIRTQRRDDVSAALSLQRVDRSELSRLGVVEIEGSLVTKVVEKPPPSEAPTDIATLPLYVLPPDILDYLDEVPLSSRGEYEIQDAIQMLIQREGGVRGVFTEERLDLTRPEDLLTINCHYLAQGRDAEVAPTALRADTQVIPPVRVEEGITIGENCVIGPYVYLERGSELGPNVNIREAVVLKGAKVAEGTIVKKRVFG